MAVFKKTKYRGILFKNKKNKSIRAAMIQALLAALLYASCGADFLVPLPPELPPAYNIEKRTLVDASADGDSVNHTTQILLQFDGDLKTIDRNNIILSSADPTRCLLAKEALTPVHGKPGEFTLSIGAVTKEPVITAALVMISLSSTASGLELRGSRQITVYFLPGVQAAGYKIITLSDAAANGSALPAVPTDKLELTITAAGPGIFPAAGFSADDILAEPLTAGLSLKKGVLRKISENVSRPYTQTWELELSQVSKTGFIRIEINKRGYILDNFPLDRRLYAVEVRFLGAVEEAASQTIDTTTNRSTGAVVVLEFNQDLPGLELSDITVTPAIFQTGNFEKIQGETGKYRFTLQINAAAWRHEVEVSINPGECIITPPTQTLFLSLKRIDSLRGVSSAGGLNYPQGYPLALRKVPAGKFRRNGNPAAVTTLSRPYYMSETEITRELWFAVMGYWPGGAASWTILPPGHDHNKAPINHVTWVEAVVFCNILSEKAGKPPVYRISGWYLTPRANSAFMNTDPDASRKRLVLESAYDQALHGPKRGEIRIANWEHSTDLIDGVEARYIALSNDGNVWNKEDNWVNGVYTSGAPTGINYALYILVDNPDFNPAIAQYVMKNGLTIDWGTFNLGTKFRDADSDWPLDNSWHDAGMIQINERANGYRIPSHNQWKWAAMGADMSPSRLVNGVNVTDWSKSFSGSRGNNDITNYTWFNDNRGAGSTAYAIWETGTKLPNELGLYDMSGSMWEWCWDPWNGHLFTPGSEGAGAMGDADYYGGPDYSGLDGRICMGGWGQSSAVDISLVSWAVVKIDSGDADIGLRIMRYAEAWE